MLLCAEGQLDHPLQELIAGKSHEVAQDQLLGIESDEIAELERLAARGEDKVAMAVVDDDEVALGIEAGAPRSAGRPLEGVAGQTLRWGIGLAELGDQLVGDSDQRLAGASRVALPDDDLQSRHTGLGRCMVDDGLMGCADKTARAFDDAPFELEITLDPAPRSIARKSAQLAALADADNARRWRDGDAEQRPCELEEVALSGCAEIWLGGAGGGVARRGCRGLLSEPSARLRAKCLRMDIEPIVFFGRQRQQ